MRQVLTHSAQLGKIIVGRRRASGLSQRVLAAKLALSQNRWSEIESDAAALTVGRLLELANVLGLELIVQDRQAANRLKNSEW